MPQTITTDIEEAEIQNDYTTLCIPYHPAPVNVSSRRRDYSHPIFYEMPFLGPLLFDNTDSDARDHCANERTFLSYLRLSIYMTVVSIAIVISFHLKSEPSQLELRMAQPLGIVFFLLSLACLVLGFGNYIKTVNKYSRRVAIVQTGWKTQSVCYFPLLCSGERGEGLMTRSLDNVPPQKWALRASTSDALHILPLAPSNWRFREVEFTKKALYE